MIWIALTLPVALTLTSYRQLICERRTLGNRLAFYCELPAGLPKRRVVRGSGGVSRWWAAHFEARAAGSGGFWSRVRLPRF
jgi:hypothetical protein